MLFDLSTIPKAITFDLTVGFPISLVFWKLDIQSFLRTQDQLNPSLERPLNTRPKLNQKKLELSMSAGVASAHCVAIGS